MNCRFIVLAILLALCISANAQTIFFVPRDTTIIYSDGDQSYEYPATVSNLLAQARTFVFTINPVDFPDTNRSMSICTWQGCYPPRSGYRVLTEQYSSLQVDTLVKFDVYNSVIDWSLGFPLPVDSIIWGNYVFDVSLSSEDNPTEVITYRYRLEYSEHVISIRTENIPSGYQLLSNYPNPFNGQTSIQFSISKAGSVSLSVYDIAGRTVANLLSGQHVSTGQYEVRWDASTDNNVSLSSGSYFVRLATNDNTLIHRITYLR